MTGPSKTSWIISTLLHGGLVALLIFGPSLRPTVKPELPGGPVIEAVFVDPKLLDLAPLEEPEGPTPAEIERAERQRLEQEQADRDQRAQREQERQEEQERQDQIRRDKEIEDERIKAEADAKIKEDQEKERRRVKRLEDEKKEQLRIAKEKEDADRIERERLAAEEADRVKKAKEAEDRAREAKKKQEEQERLEAKRKADELEAKKKADALAARKKREAEELARQMQREEELRRMMGLEDQRNAAVDDGLLAQYIAQIVARVERNWNRPPSARDDLSCTVRATQIPGGDVVSVEIGKCNGDAAVRRSIENAVNKAAPLPEPADPTLFERNLVFVFEPN